MIRLEKLTLTTFTFALALSGSSLLAGPAAGATGATGAKPGGGPSAAAGSSGLLRPGESMIMELEVAAGEVRVDALVEREMIVEITDLKGRNKRKSLIYADKPRKFTIGFDRATRLRIRIVRAPSGPFHHLPARAESGGAGFLVKVASKPSPILAAAASSGSPGLLRDAGEVGSSRSGAAAGGARSKGGVKTSQ
ncbi:MAG: hypothetical protein ACF8XB_01675 [Planctomycetota bacterium JB042]